MEAVRSGGGDLLGGGLKIGATTSLILELLPGRGSGGYSNGIDGPEPILFDI